MKNMWHKMVEKNTVKITIAVFLSVSFYTIFHMVDESSLLLITLTNAIFGIRPKTVDTWIFFRYRLLGTTIGCILGSLYLVVSVHITQLKVINVILIPLFACLTVVFSGGEKAPTTVRGAVMTLISMILLVAPDNDKNYVFHRIMATFLGLLISILVNWVIAPKKEHLVEEFKESIDEE